MSEFIAHLQLKWAAVTEAKSGLLHCDEASCLVSLSVKYTLEMEIIPKSVYLKPVL